METARLNIAYKSILVGVCLMATLWNSQCEAADIVAAETETQTIEACQQDAAVLITDRS